MRQGWWDGKADTMHGALGWSGPAGLGGLGWMDRSVGWRCGQGRVVCWAGLWPAGIGGVRRCHCGVWAILFCDSPFLFGFAFVVSVFLLVSRGWALRLRVCEG